MSKMLCQADKADLGYSCGSDGVVWFPVMTQAQDRYLCVTCAQKIQNAQNNIYNFYGKNCFCCSRPASEIIWLGANPSYLCAEHKEIMNKQQEEHIWEIRMQRASESKLLETAAGFIRGMAIADWTPRDFIR